MSYVLMCTTMRSATGASRRWCLICLRANRLAPIRCTAGFPSPGDFGLGLQTNSGPSQAPRGVAGLVLVESKANSRRAVTVSNLAIIQEQVLGIRQHRLTDGPLIISPALVAR